MNDSKTTHKTLVNYLSITPQSLNCLIRKLERYGLNYKGINYTLGYIYELGIIKIGNKAQNIKQAIKYYDAGAFIEPKCAEKLARWYFDGKNVKSSIKKAIKLYEYLIYNKNKPQFALELSKKMTVLNYFKLSIDQRLNALQRALQYAKRAVECGVEGAEGQYEKLSIKINIMHIRNFRIEIFTKIKLSRQKNRVELRKMKKQLRRKNPIGSNVTIPRKTRRYSAYYGGTTLVNRSDSSSTESKRNDSVTTPGSKRGHSSGGKKILNPPPNMDTPSQKREGSTLFKKQKLNPPPQKREE